MTKHNWERALGVDGHENWLEDLSVPYQCSVCGMLVYVKPGDGPEDTLTHQMSDCDLVIIKKVVHS